MPAQSQLAKDTFTYWAAVRSIETPKDRTDLRAWKLLYRLTQHGSSEALRLAAGKALIKTALPQVRL